MSTDAKATGPPPPPPGSGTLIPENFIDVPSQRLYFLSLGVLCQAIKVFDILQHVFLPKDAQTSYGRKWFFFDFVYCVSLANLRIPRLRYSKSVVALQILSLWILDGVLFGGITFNVGGGYSWMGLPSLNSHRADIISTAQPSGLWSFLPSLGLGSLTSSGADRDGHLLGQHTVRMSPISTANLNPYGQTFCLAAPGNTVILPILLNNTSPSGIQYSVSPLGDTEGKVDIFDLTPKDLKSFEQTRLRQLQTAGKTVSKKDAEDYNEYDDEDESDTPPSDQFPPLQKTQGLAHIVLSQPGTLRLERVVDAFDVDARLVYPNEVTVAPCPRAEFTDKVIAPGEDIHCATPGLAAGAGEEMTLGIDVFGVPPLSLRWYKEVGGRREQFMVEGIESSEYGLRRSVDEGRTPSGLRGRRAPVQLSVPLTVALDSLGTHSYVLESVTDGIGNVIQAGSSPISSGFINASEQAVSSPTSADSRVTRSLTVLRRPSVSFKGCGPGNPASLLIGSEAPVTISALQADALDAPWDVTVKYQPLAAENGKKKSSGKRHKSWTKSLQSQYGKTDYTMLVDAPGEYTITGVKGKYCEGDILSPDTCKVIERPIPTAEIEWKKIHECSGDTGVSASLVFHGTPPFQVYYRMQRDHEAPRELFKTFTTSRGELTIQPERSGHYVFKFVQLSDANYQKVALKGPSIDQVVHSPASADFANNVPGGNGRRKINSCSGNMVDVDVDLRGTRPWTLDVQVVGPKGSEIVRVANITTSRQTLHLPIPKAVDKDGGMFEIDLVSVEDAYGCKRALSVPGVAVNVRRIQSTAKFYGAADKRHVTILDNEQASLPLRLTGDGPWHLKYRRAEAPEQVYSASVSSPNGDLRVFDKGHYEILEVADSQCPGAVIANDATYRVDHVPRPSAKLSSQIQSTFESFNGSHILPAICEGINDHVDLELTGRPPFQIVYNVAEANEQGGTNLLDQPTFSSIQPRTNFQLHTTKAARMFYEVKQIGDAAYPLGKNNDAVIPRSQRLLFEQQVLMRPFARFKNHNRLSYCLNDALSPRDSTGPDGLILLQGTPPFQVRLSIRNLATSEVFTEVVQTRDSTWKLNIPSYSFHSIGPHLVNIESVADASHCEQAAADPLYRSIWADVAETAAIVPFDTRTDFCVDDIIQFQLEGTPPWSIGYRVNGKPYTQDVKISPFSVMQQHSGEFVITSIAHQQKMCKTAVTDLRYTIHPLPSAQVGHGKRIVQDIHEGDQAEIVFTLDGEPPFTFTYQRAELTSKSGVQGKVLETHTVSGVTTKEYSIFSALEGTWTVTFISDRYCRYPAAQPDSLAEKSRR
ncbi:hypothetical protein SCP_0105020 [Sparassis crispa]|uniref:Nucleoporin n=1 Tax=Sparassis crispa TaxID=139825 RepID=A0A401G628_9APHY|nr:hypothetical protein SCP_0105020 [Sparassis crispa]GBE77622.1 hypothetical protein SCP_0105020 [Sparassis crispa]